MPTPRFPFRTLALFALLVAGCQPKSPAKPPEQPLAGQPLGSKTPLPTDSFREIGMVAQANRVPVIMYHDVIQERGRGSEWFDVTAKEFKDQMQWIVDQGIVPISVNDLYGHLTEGAPIPERAVVLTFDDNYQGFYDIAWPILQQYNFPAMMFVHTGYVGDTTRGRPKMTWDELKELTKNPLFTVGAHTVNHPADITLLTPEKQYEEMKTSKDVLEKQLGVSVPFLAYPDGKNDKTTQQLAKKSGFLMAFTIDNMLAEESPNILAVGRYVHTRLQKAWEDRDRTVDGAPAGIYQQDLRDAPVASTSQKIDGVDLILVTGGRPITVQSSTRQGVMDFVKQNSGIAGINGTFFSMAAIKGTDNRMVGPCKTSDLPLIMPDEEPFRWPKLRNRPIVIWGAKQIAFVPFQPETMNSDEAFRQFMPGFTDMFLAGAWLIHQGVARTREQMELFGSKDAQDPRRRAFFGVMSDGSVVLGASHNSCSSEMLARAAADAGVAEAVLLDSGFSTSLVYDGEILASGHSTKTTPSRPVPHAIVVLGKKSDAPVSSDPAPPKDESGT